MILMKYANQKEYGRPHCAHLELAKGAMAARAAVARLTVSKHDYHFINQLFDGADVTILQPAVQRSAVY